MRVASMTTGRQGGAAIRFLLAVVAAGAVYLGGLQGTANDPVRWLHPIPPDDKATLERLAAALPEELQRTMLQSLLAQLDEGGRNQAVRKLAELAGERYPQLRHAVAGAIGRKALALGRQPGQVKAALTLAQAACDMVDDDPRPRDVLRQLHEKAGNNDEAVKALAEAERLRANYPDVTGTNHAIGVGAPLGAFVLTWIAFGIAGGPRRSGVVHGIPTPPPRMAPAGPETIAALAAPSAAEVAAAVSRAEAASAAGPVGPGPVGGPGKITQVLGAEERLEQAKLLLEEGQFEDAQVVFTKAVEINPALSKKVASLCVVAGKRLYDQGNTDMAERAFSAAAAFDENDIRAQTYLANCMVKRGDFDRAVEHYLHVCSIDPQGAIGFYNLGICYEKTQEVDSAIKAFNHALSLDPKMANCHFYLAKIHEGQHNRDHAIHHWKACLEMAPGTPQAQRAEQRLAKLAQSKP